MNTQHSGDWKSSDGEADMPQKLSVLILYSVQGGRVIAYMMHVCSPSPPAVGQLACCVQHSREHQEILP